MTNIIFQHLKSWLQNKENLYFHKKNNIHIAFILYRKNIIYKPYFNHKNHHAEERCIHDITHSLKYNLKKVSIISLRIDKDFNFKISLPCKKCLNLLKTYNIKGFLCS